MMTGNARASMNRKAIVQTLTSFLFFIHATQERLAANINFQIFMKSYFPEGFKASSLFLILFLSSINCLSAAYYTDPTGLQYTLNEQSKTAILSNAENFEGTELSVPEKFTYQSIQYIVTEIGKNAFIYTPSVTSIQIPNSVQTIQTQAFYNCKTLQTVNIPSSVSSIGDYAFMGCEKLQSIVLPGSLNTLGIGLFSGCASLNSAVLPTNLLSIPTNLFDGCVALATITLPTSLTSLGNYAFNDCTSLKSIVIPEGITTLGDYTFYGCTSLEYVTIPSTLTATGVKTFDRCLNLKKVEISDISSWCDIDFVLDDLNDYDASSNPLYYAESIWYDGKEISNLVIPDNVSIIKWYVFYNASHIITVNTGNGVKEIDFKAFANNTSLTNLTLGASTDWIGSEAFGNCTALTTVNCYAKKPPYCSLKAFEGCNMSSLTLHVPQGSLEMYSSSDGWNLFESIIDDLTVEQNDNDKNEDAFILEVSNEDGLNDCIVEIFDDAGIFISKAQVKENELNNYLKKLNLPSGIYIIKSNNRTIKLVI